MKNDKLRLNRQAFLDITGTSIARWYWSNPALIDTFDLTTLKAQDFGVLASLFPDSPSASYGSDVIDAIKASARKVQKNNTSKRSVMVSYTTASKVAQCLNISSMRMWNKFVQDNFSPLELPFPVLANKFYVNEWTDWPTFFGSTAVEFFSYNDAKAFVEKLGIRTVPEYREYISSGLSDPRMPSRPDVVYADKWSGWPNFLVSRFMSFYMAKKVMSKLDVCTELEFRKLGRNRPSYMPSHPSLFYADKWKGWADFLDTKKKRALRQQEQKQEQDDSNIKRFARKSR